MGLPPQGCSAGGWGFRRDFDPQYAMSPAPMMYVAPGSIVGRLLHALLPGHSAESASAPMRHRDGWDEVETREGR